LAVLPLVCGCLLTTSLDGLSGGGETAATPDAAPTPGTPPEKPPDVPPPPGDDDASTTHDTGAADTAADGTPDAPPGPITFVQVNANAMGKTTALAVALAKPVQAHSAIVVAGDVGGMPVISIADTLGSAFTPVTMFDSNRSERMFIYVALDVTGGADTVTLTLPVAAGIELYVHEYANIARSGAFDKQSCSIGTASSQVTDGMKSGKVTTISPNELLFGLAISGSVDPGTGFAPRSRLNANVTEDRIGATAGDYEATATVTSAPDNWTMCMATFRGL
jgi:hypothetical protein